MQDVVDLVLDGWLRRFAVPVHPSFESFACCIPNVPGSMAVFQQLRHSSLLLLDEKSSSGSTVKEAMGDAPITLACPWPEGHALPRRVGIFPTVRELRSDRSPQLAKYSTKVVRQPG
jgi:hypothetical protein